MNSATKASSLQDIMNEMAGRMDTLLDQRDRNAATPDIKVRQSSMLDEAQMWLSVDPLLASLHKQLCDAEEHLTALKRQRGPRDPMTEIASDMADSAKCAVDTRILELREDDEAKARMQAVIRSHHANRERALAAEEHAKSARFWSNFGASRRARTPQQRGADSFAAMLLGIVVLQQLVGEANRQLSIASMFCNLAAGSIRRIVAT